MGKQTFYLRPSSDISRQHSVKAGLLEYGYSSINDYHNDGTSTYIYVSQQADVIQKYSEFGISLTGTSSEHNKIKKVNKAYVKVCGWSESSHTGYTGLLLFDATGNQKYFRFWPYSADYNIDRQGKVEEDTTIAALINELIDNGKLNELSNWKLMVDTRVESDGGEKSNNSYVSQAVFQLECEYGDDINIYDKVNGIYKPAEIAYKKANGTWIEITEDEAKSILNNNTIRRG